MLKSNLLAAAALTLVLAAPAAAQTGQQAPAANAQAAPTATPTPQQSSTAAQIGFLARQTPDEWRGSKLIGVSVYGPDDKSIGDIKELIVGPTGEVRAAVIGVGGFLGIGEKNVAVPFQSLHITRKPNTSSIERIAIGATKDELQKAPKFAYLKANGANNTTATGSAGTELPASPQR